MKANKNIHVLPTPNESRLYYNSQEKKYQLCEFPKCHTDIKSTHNLYITNDEEIKVGDWVLDDEQDVFQVLEINHITGILRSDGFAYVIDVCKKIILTIDVKLITYDVQAIPDEFLEWFVKNPSCEEVEVKEIYNSYGETDIFDLVCTPHSFNYKIIIPKEKQETLEEVLKKIKSIKLCLMAHPNNEVDSEFADRITDLKEIQNELSKAKWQAERSYSEEDMHNLMDEYQNWLFNTNDEILTFREWFEQFKKK